MHNIRGLETLYRQYQGELLFKSDCVVVAMHYLMINEGMLCGEVWANPSEMLPAGWNENHGVYTLPYVGGDRNNRVLVEVRGGRRILHVSLVVDDEEVDDEVEEAMLLFVDLDRFVGHHFDESFERAYTDPAALLDAIEEHLLQRMRRILEPTQNHPSPDGRSLI